MKRKFRLVTFGCKVNQYESEEIRQGLMLSDWEEADPQGTFDVAVVNTCTVTDRSDRKSRQAIRSLTRACPRAQIIVTGCYALTGADRLRTMSGVTDVLPDKAAVLRRLTHPQEGPGREGRGPRLHTRRTRALLKVQDGCTAGCAYCIVPHVRPVQTSQPPEEVVNEARALVEAGHREVVLTGVHVGRYGKDLPDRPTLEQLVTRLGEIDGLWRIRLSSVELFEVTDGLADLMSGGKLCPHLHVPLQSGDDAVLTGMRRGYRAGQFRERALELKSRVKDLSLTTDIIVAFPGETEEAFQRSMQLARDLEFSKIHVFPFSPRAGTPATDLPGRLPPQTVRRRRDSLLELSDELGLRFRQRFLNRTVEVLVEGESPTDSDPVEGLSREYLRVRIVGCRPPTGGCVNVRIAGVDARLMHGPVDRPSA